MTGTMLHQDALERINGNKNKLAEMKAEGERTLNKLHGIQIALAFCMIGGSARLVLTALNGFSPGVLNDAFDDFDDAFDLSESGAAAMRAIIATTFFCIALDVYYFIALRTKDKCDLKRKLWDYEAAVAANNSEIMAAPGSYKDGSKAPLNPTKFSKQEAEDILENARSSVKKQLKDDASARAKYLILIREDIIIRQLMIECHIHREDLLQRIEQEGEKADIPELITDYSTHISLSDYKNEHAKHQKRMRNIERAQGVKYPLRFISMLLLLDDRAFELPHLFNKIGLDAWSIHDATYEWVIVSGICLYALMLYATQLEFKKNDTLIELEKEERKLKNTEQNALLATLMLALQRKANNDTFNPIKAPPKVEKEETFFPWLNTTLYNALGYKFIISLLCLGSLGRRPFTISGLAGEDDPENAVLAAILCGVVLAIALDVKQISLSAKEERWGVKNKEDERYVAAATQALGEPSSADELSGEDKILHDYLTARPSRPASPTGAPDSTDSRPATFKTSHPWLHKYKDTFDKMLWLKFALRAVGVTWGVIQIAASDSFKEDHVGALSTTNFCMILAGFVGFVLGFVAYKMNIARDNLIKDHDNDAQNTPGTKNTLLYFKDPVVPNSPTAPRPTT